MTVSKSSVLLRACLLGAALGASLGLRADVTWYAVDPMAETQFLPDKEPVNGLKGEPVRMVAAKGEFEPGSFVLTADADLGKVDFKVGDLKSKDGAVFSAKEIDVRTVKVWYQNQNGWWSYFADDSFKLCPELLLHDEDLIRVDEKKMANYARLTEKDGRVRYHWLTPPKDVENRLEDSEGGRIDDAFFSMKPNFMDAETFKGATVEKNRFKQFLLTVHVPKETKPGLYAGEIVLVQRKGGKKLGAVPVVLRVLPFELPEPCTFGDCNKPFLTWFCSYIGYGGVMDINGGDRDLATKQLKAIALNFIQHNNTVHLIGFDGEEEFSRTHGADMKHRHYGGMHLTSDKAEIRYDARRKRERMIKVGGEDAQGYLSWGDEYQLNTLRKIRDMVKIYHEQGFGFTVNSGSGYSAGGYLADLWWPPKFPDERSKDVAEHFNNLGGKGYFGWYACQHVGAENPAFNRRQYGLAPYRAGLSCNYNYAHHLQGWNDRASIVYRPMMFVYGVGNGCLDTIQWEGFREGLDDIRYATLLKRLAMPLVDSKNIDGRYVAKKALQYLSDLDHDNYDLTTVRLEMIRHILKLQEVSK